MKVFLCFSAVISCLFVFGGCQYSQGQKRKLSAGSKLRIVSTCYWDHPSTTRQSPAFGPVSSHSSSSSSESTVRCSCDMCAILFSLIHPACSWHSDRRRYFGVRMMIPISLTEIQPEGSIHAHFVGSCCFPLADGMTIG